MFFKNIAKELGEKFLCLQSANCCDITECNKIKWNPKTMNESKNIGYNHKEYVFSHSIVNIHSGDEFVYYKEAVQDKRQRPKTVRVSTPQPTKAVRKPSTASAHA